MKLPQPVRQSQVNTIIHFKGFRCESAPIDSPFDCDSVAYEQKGRSAFCVQQPLCDLDAKAPKWIHTVPYSESH